MAPRPSGKGSVLSFHPCDNAVRVGEPQTVSGGRVVEFFRRHLRFLRLALPAGGHQRALARRYHTFRGREFSARLGLADFQAFTRILETAFARLL